MFTIPAHAFEVAIKICKQDIDQLNHVNNTVYLKWVQDVAIAHWKSLTTYEQRNQWVWVVARHEIDYLRPCFFNDQLLAYTWLLPDAPKGSDRIVVFKNKTTGKLVAQVKSNWVLVNPITQRSTPLTHELKMLLGI